MSDKKGALLTVAAIAENHDASRIVRACSKLLPSKGEQAVRCPKGLGAGLYFIIKRPLTQKEGSAPWATGVARARNDKGDNTYTWSIVIQSNWRTGIVSNGTTRRGGQTPDVMQRSSTFQTHRSRFCQLETNMDY